MSPLVRVLSAVVALAALTSIVQAADPPAVPKASDEALGTRRYQDYEKPQACAACHVDIARQHEQAMMSQSYTHHWDEIEYFEPATSTSPASTSRP
jgi:hypothetical protein